MLENIITLIVIFEVIFTIIYLKKPVKFRNHEIIVTHYLRLILFIFVFFEVIIILGQISMIRENKVNSQTDFLIVLIINTILNLFLYMIIYNRKIILKENEFEYYNLLNVKKTYDYRNVKYIIKKHHVYLYNFNDKKIISIFFFVMFHPNLCDLMNKIKEEK